ncbi:prolyl oligopeptidase family serine peptidase [Haloferula rosea]|uniref:prolyl oligopeptidase n=1 Tax=Haloferula rosea TaxID=490093 RepID=A0A934VCQ8_9BACT|nr:prolyl oligopeptidase family serine peptidase [Haloferula rosea]MBK1828708.1 S9 family peptidase [Haloferula rosea]
MTTALIALATALSYPDTRIDETVETLHGIKVADPYRWLEDDHSEETKAWVKSQNKVTQAYLSGLPQRAEIHDRTARLLDFERIGTPREFGGRWFFTYNSGLQNQSVLMTSASLGGEPELLLDPNSLSKEGTVSLADWTPSKDGKLLAWALSRGGSDWKEIRVRDVTTGKDLKDHLRWVKFSGISWLPDGSGFYYSRYDAPDDQAELTGRNENHQLWFHRIGTPQSADRLVYRRVDHPTWGFYGGVTDDGSYLVIHVSDGTSTKNRSFYQKLGDKTDGDIVELLNEADAAYRFLGNVGSRFFYRTNLDAPRYRVIAIDIENPGREHWEEIIPQSDENLDEVSLVGGHLVCSYLKDARSVIRVHDLNGKHVRDVDLPGLGSAGGFRGRLDDTHTFYGFSSFTDPGAIHRYELATGKSELWRKPDIDFDGSGYVTKQVFIPSKDGTKVPAFIVHRKGIELDGSHRTLLYGYGGFNIPVTPGFSVSRAVWLERGGVFVLACIRGGGEYGKEWHESAIRLKKQNSYDDFIAIAEWLTENGYTSPKKLAIQGGSNGGLLVGACMTQRPELFGACLPAVGVMDLLRFHKFTIGWAWKRDYGDPENPEEFANLLKISPYHNLKPSVRYPATLVTTADHDDRVVPAHSFKFAARLQACQPPDGPPVLIRIDTSAGHGAGTALDKVIDLAADQWAFLEDSLKD